MGKLGKELSLLVKEVCTTTLLLGFEVLMFGGPCGAYLLSCCHINSSNYMYQVRLYMLPVTALNISYKTLILARCHKNFITPCKM